MELCQGARHCSLDSQHQREEEKEEAELRRCREQRRIEKLDSIAACFAADTVMISPSGAVLSGSSGVREFYGSSASPVMQSDVFVPQPVASSLCFSDDGHTIAVVRTDYIKYKLKLSITFTINMRTDGMP